MSEDWENRPSQCCRAQGDVFKNIFKIERLRLKDIQFTVKLSRKIFVLEKLEAANMHQNLLTELISKLSSAMLLFSLFTKC